MGCSLILSLSLYTLNFIILYIDLSNAHCMKFVFPFIPERWSFLGLGIFR